MDVKAFRTRLEQRIHREETELRELQTQAREKAASLYALKDVLMDVENAERLAEREDKSKPPAAPPPRQGS